MVLAVCFGCQGCGCSACCNTPSRGSEYHGNHIAQGGIKVEHELNANRGSSESLQYDNKYQNTQGASHHQSYKRQSKDGKLILSIMQKKSNGSLIHISP